MSGVGGFTRDCGCAGSRDALSLAAASLRREFLDLDSQVAIERWHHDTKKADLTFKVLVDVSELELRPPAGHVEDRRLTGVAVVTLDGGKPAGSLKLDRAQLVATIG